MRCEKPAPCFVNIEILAIALSAIVTSTVVGLALSLLFFCTINYFVVAQHRV